MHWQPSVHALLELYYLSHHLGLTAGAFNQLPLDLPTNGRGCTDRCRAWPDVLRDKLRAIEMRNEPAREREDARPPSAELPRGQRQAGRYERVRPQPLTSGEHLFDCSKV